MATTVVLAVECESTLPGQAVFVVGSHYLLGNWSPLRAQKLTTTPATFPRWRTDDLVFAHGETLNYKFVVQREDWTGDALWEDIEGNRVLDIRPGMGSVVEQSVWNFAPASATDLRLPAAGVSAPAVLRASSIDERGKAITPAIARAAPGSAEKVEALIVELAATDKLLVERNNYCRRLEMEMGGSKRRVADQELEFRAQAQRLAQAEQELEASKQQSSEKDAKLEDMQRRIALLEVLACSNVGASEAQAQAQRQETMISKLQRQCADKDAEVKKLQKQKDQLAAKKEGVRTGQKYTWKACHSLRAR